MKTIRGILLSILVFLAFGFTTAFAGEGGYNYSARVVYGEEVQFRMPYIIATLYRGDNVVTSTVTDKHGVFKFKKCENGVEYTVKFSSNFVPKGVVNLKDAALLQKYLENSNGNLKNNKGVELTPLQLKAADANEDNKVDDTDLDFIKNNLLVYGEDYPAGGWIMPDWTFSSKHFKSASATSGIDGPITIVSRTDISSDLPPVIKDASTVVHASKEFFFTEKNNVLTIPVSFREKQTIMGLGLNLAFNNDEVEIIGLSSIFNDAIYTYERNTFKLICLDDYSTSINADQAFINLQVRIHNTDNLEAVLIALSEAQFVSEDGMLIQNVQLNMPQLKKSIADFSIGNAYPNPGNSEINFAINQAWTETVLIKIYNLAGQQVKEINASPLNSKITITTSDLPNGSYLCSVNIDSNREVKLISVLH